MNWGCYEHDDGTPHVMPMDDLREHSFEACWCRPYEDDGVIVHNSMDLREQFERGRKVS